MQSDLSHISFLSLRLRLTLCFLVGRIKSNHKDCFNFLRKRETLSTMKVKENVFNHLETCEKILIQPKSLISHDENIFDREGLLLSKTIHVISVELLRQVNYFKVGSFIGSFSFFMIVNIKKGPEIPDSVSYSLGSCPFSIDIAIPNSFYVFKIQ